MSVSLTHSRPEVRKFPACKCLPLEKNPECVAHSAPGQEALRVRGAESGLWAGAARTSGQQALATPRGSPTGATQRAGARRQDETKPAPKRGSMLVRPREDRSQVSWASTLEQQEHLLSVRGAWGRWQEHRGDAIRRYAGRWEQCHLGALLRDAAFAALWFSLCLRVARARTHLQVTRLQAPGLRAERGKFSVAKKAWFQGK